MRVGPRYGILRQERNGELSFLCQGKEMIGKEKYGRQGGVWNGFARKDSEWQAWRVQAPKGTASLGAAGMARRGTEWLGRSRPVMEGQAWWGKEIPGQSWYETVSSGKAGKVGSGNRG